MTATSKIKPLKIRNNRIVEDEDSPEDLLFYEGWQPTSEAMEIDVEESLRVAETIEAWPKQCFFNARKAVLRLKEYANASYVEGWALVGLNIEHGWIVRNGMIIDPTLPESGGQYFPGLEFNGRAGIREFLATTKGRKCKQSPFLYAFGWGGWNSPSFRRCYQECNDALHAKYGVAKNGAGEGGEK